MSGSRSGWCMRIFTGALPLHGVWKGDKSVRGRESQRRRSSAPRTFPPGRVDLILPMPTPPLINSYVDVLTPSPSERDLIWN